MLRLNAFLLTALLLLVCRTGALAQNRPVGYWRAHLPTNAAQGIATDGLTNYVITRKGFFTFRTTDSYPETFSKVEGMHDTNPVAVDFDRTTGTCIIGYESTNIDLFRHNNFKVLPDLKNKTFSGSKAINHIFAKNGLAYVSTSLGIVVIDLERQEVKETYVFSRAGQTMGIYAFGADSLYNYAASQGGIYRISRNATAPQVFSNWEPVDTQRTYVKLAVVKNNVFAATTGFTDTLFHITGLNARQRVFYQDSTAITHIDGGQSVVYAGIITKKGAGICYHFSTSDQKVDSTSIAYTRGVIEKDVGRPWVADLYQGLGKKEDDRRMTFFVPGGPSDADNIDLYVRNNDVWVAHGGISNFYLNLNKKSGISHFTNDHWETLTAYNTPLFYDTVTDFLVLAKDERAGTLYAGTYTSGIYERKADNSTRMIKKGELQSTPDGLYPVTGLVVDLNGNLWVNQIGLSNELAVKTPEGIWYHYPVPKLGRYFANSGARIIVDDLNQKWYLSPSGGGVIVYNDGGTPETNADDDYRNLLRGKGQGDLPSNTVISLVKDRDGAIWIGTDKGIGIASSPSQIMADKTSDVEQRVVQYDQFAGILFANESVQAMAVDGANRKWVGTTNGVWLLSADASKIINRFTVDNSPLPSNIIQSIAVDPITGDVYFGTPDGLVSYHGTATEGSETANDIKSFPSPVPSSYNGPITMKGFTTDADVRITDIAGQLVYRAKAAGVQLVWNGLDYTGHRPQSGVLLIFATNRDGSQTAVGKLMMMH
jgi:ligand-binding sensor domain-containing protein